MVVLYFVPEFLDKKILIVDDEKQIKELLSEIFSFNGYKTILASNGKEAVDILRDKSCGLLITDLNMPDMDGIELVRKIRSFDISLPIIGMSCKDKETEFLHAGADYFLLKPFNIYHLKFIVNSILGK